MIVLSPHLDDAVWSAHGLLEGATVVTICAGIPPEDAGPTQFDVRAGFQSGADAVRARRAEDLAAAARVGYTAVHLDVLDSGYGGGDIAVAAAGVLERAAGHTVVGPVGLRHPDHHAVASAFRTVARALDLHAWMYEDLPYAYVWPENLAPALTLAEIGEVTITRLSAPAKRDAVEEYQSQTKGAHMDAILAPERYHLLNGTVSL